ncbi:MAG: arsenate reductase ArsC [Microbacteriaceae bacterium]|nr:arsenate reductase ArsC [Microbacteriaceae bacterium]
MATETDTDARPHVLFLCVHNAGRSQMALGFFEHYAGDRAVGTSGGSEPADQVNPVAIAVMAERGIDISKEYPKPWTTVGLQAADAIITMGCGDECPYYPGKRYEDWELTDPKGKDLETVRAIRDDIEQRVIGLLESLGVPVTTRA